MKKLDWYIARKFLGAYIFMILAIMSIAIVIDVSEKLRDFLDPAHDLNFTDVAFGYYPYFFLHYANLFSSLIIFLAVLFFTGKMAQRSEVIAILSNGVSFLRYTRPYFLVSTFLLVIALLMNHFIVPHANKKRLEFESSYVLVVGGIYHNVNLQMDEKTIVHYGSMNLQRNQVGRLWVETWETDAEGKYQMVSDLQANSCKGDSLTNRWLLSNVFIRTIYDSNEVVRTYKELDTTLNFKPEDLGQRENIMEAMSTGELIEYRNRERNKGSTLLPSIEIALYERTSLPFAAYILTMIGIAVASRKSREGVGGSLVLGMIVSVSYVFFMKMMTVAATNVGLKPIIAVWVPNIIYSFIAIWLYYRRIKE